MLFYVIVLQLHILHLLKNSMTVKKGVALFKIASVKKLKIKGGGQEVALMV